MKTNTSVLFYVAASLDGYIATSDGGVDWLSQFEAEGEDYGYAAFFESIDGLLMGRATYDQVLGFGEWVYGEKPCWVCTGRSLHPPKPNIFATTQGTCKKIKSQFLREKAGRASLLSQKLGFY